MQAMGTPVFVSRFIGQLNLVPGNNAPYYQIQVSPDGNTAYAARGGC
jgi:putative alpha-1,2-mannosidase